MLHTTLSVDLTTVLKKGTDITLPDGSKASFDKDCFSWVIRVDEMNESFQLVVYEAPEAPEAWKLTGRFGYLYVNWREKIIFESDSKELSMKNTGLTIKAPSDPKEKGTWKRWTFYAKKNEQDKWDNILDFVLTTLKDDKGIIGYKFELKNSKNQQSNMIAQEVVTEIPDVDDSSLPF